ncbi:MAG: hypothetical protein ACK5L6_03635 [Anaerorhabdus sp.]|uniref:hypothetical protein n=1 Tax=Anaerorhabdus sp. TaxID=1872524 RepID=UPI003A88ED02
MNKRRLRKPIGVFLKGVAIIGGIYIMLILMALYIGEAHAQSLNKYQHLQIEQEEIVNESEW